MQYLPCNFNYCKKVPRKKGRLERNPWTSRDSRNLPAFIIKGIAALSCVYSCTIAMVLKASNSLKDACFIYLDKNHTTRNNKSIFISFIDTCECKHAIIQSHKEDNSKNIFLSLTPMMHQCPWHSRLDLSGSAILESKIGFYQISPYSQSGTGSPMYPSKC